MHGGVYFSLLYATSLQQMSSVLRFLLSFSAILFLFLSHALSRNHIEGRNRLSPCCKQYQAACNIVQQSCNRRATGVQHACNMSILLSQRDTQDQKLFYSLLKESVSACLASSCLFVKKPILNVRCCTRVARVLHACCTPVARCCTPCVFCVNHHQHHHQHHHQRHHQYHRQPHHDNSLSIFYKGPRRPS